MECLYQKACGMLVAELGSWIRQLHQLSCRKGRFDVLQPDRYETLRSGMDEISRTRISA
jgi:hypothetical protein